MLSVCPVSGHTWYVMDVHRESNYRVLKPHKFMFDHCSFQNHCKSNWKVHGIIHKHRFYWHSVTFGLSRQFVWCLQYNRVFSLFRTAKGNKINKLPNTFLEFQLFKSNETTMFFKQELTSVIGMKLTLTSKPQQLWMRHNWFIITVQQDEYCQNMLFKLVYAFFASP